jgi:hypothetical protein
MTSKLHAISEEDQAALIDVWQRCAQEARECANNEELGDRMRDICVRLAADYDELIEALHAEFGKGFVRH